MNGVTHRLMSSGCAPKNPVIPVTSGHALTAVSGRVVRSWSRLECRTARTVRCAAIEERRAAAFHADVQRVPELRFSASQEDFSVFQ